MKTMLVRLKTHDPRRGHVLRRYTYRGIKFQVERGWYRVAEEVANYLRSVRQVASDEHSPLAFDVCTHEEAQAREADETAASASRRSAGDDIRLSEPRGALTTDDLPDADGSSRGRKPGRKRS